MDIIQFELVAAENVAQRMNIAPGQPILAIRQEASGRKAIHLKWGLVPSWAKDSAIGNKMINTRSETLQDKPSFRSAYRQRRCLIPADGFYEWQKQGKKKQPYYIHQKNEKPFAMVGLWESWHNPTGQTIETRKTRQEEGVWLRSDGLAGGYEFPRIGGELFWPDFAVKKVGARRGRVHHPLRWRH